MTPIDGDISRKVFLSAVNGKSKFVKVPMQQEGTLEFIKETFKAMADGHGTVKIGEKEIKVSELGDKELRAL